MTKKSVTAPALDPQTMEPRLGSSYPAPFRDSCGARESGRSAMRWG